MVAGTLQQLEFRGSPDRGPTVVHAELGVDVLGVSPHSVERHHKLAGDVRTVQVGSQQSKHVKLAFAQWLDQVLSAGPAVLGLVKGCQESMDITRGDPLLRPPLSAARP